MDLSSIFTLMTLGTNTIYRASKSFNRFLSLAEGETDNKNVDFLCVCPGGIQTNMYSENMKKISG